MQTKVLAIYLPQFHVIRENEKWWGKGFTEWTNVKRGKPFYRGHYQPREPLNDDYYDLSDVSVLEKHTRLAKRFGIYGFCFYHYYFKGKKLLEKPVENYRDNSRETFPYCLIWANQSWTRTWYRTNIGKRVLIEQEYGSKEDWLKHFYYLLPFFKDKRYIKIDEKPVYIIYLPQEIPCRRQMFLLWRRLAVENGFKGLYLIAMDTIAQNDSKKGMYDAFMNFEPLHALKMDTSYRKILFQLKGKLLECTGCHSNFIIKNILLRDMYTYSFLCKKIDILMREKPIQKTFIGVFSGWDNTARKDEEGWIARDSTPRKFGDNVKKALAKSQERNNEFVFVNAWNEWSEGAYIEPDKRYGYGYLRELRSAIQYFNENSIKKTEPVLLITASILPQDKRYTKLQNPQYRLQQYIDCLKFYIMETDIKQIVLCDNSAYDFQKKELFLLAEKNNKELEILQFVGDKNGIDNQGKGYGEGEIVKYALRNSYLLKKADFFIKVTGRIRITNIDTIVRKLKPDNMYFNKNLNAEKNINTIIFCISKKEYIKWFLDAYKQVCDRKGVYIEHIVNNIIYNNKLKINNLPFYPELVGESGTTGEIYRRAGKIERGIINMLSKFNLFNVNLVQVILFELFVK